MTLSSESRVVGTFKMLEDAKSRLVFDWTIPNWMENRMIYPGLFIMSPMFITTQPKSQKANSWHIRLCPGGTISFYLKHEELDGMTHRVSARWSCSIVKITGEIGERGGGSYTFSQTVSFGGGPSVNGEAVANSKNNYLKNGALTIRWEIEVKDA